MPERWGPPWREQWRRRPAFPELYPLRLLERRPAPVFFMPAGALLAGVVEQPLRDVLPDRVAAVQADRVGGLDFHGALAAAAGDAQHVTLNLRKRSLPHLGVVCAGARVLEHRFPIFRGERGVRSRSGAAGLRAASAASFSICLGVGMRQLAGRSDILELEHSKNKRSSPLRSA